MTFSLGLARRRGTQDVENATVQIDSREPLSYAGLALFQYWCLRNIDKIVTSLKVRGSMKFPNTVYRRDGEVQKKTQVKEDVT